MGTERVNDICKCGHKRKFHTEVIRPGEVKGNPYGARAYYPYKNRYKHKCRICKCDKFDDSPKN